MKVFSEDILKRIARAVFRQPPRNYKWNDDEQISYRLDAIKIFFDAIQQEMTSLLQKNYHTMALHDMQRVQRIINDIIIITKTKQSPIRIQKR